jgi:hypothetical protein
MQKIHRKIIFDIQFIKSEIKNVGLGSHRNT